MHTDTSPQVIQKTYEKKILYVLQYRVTKINQSFNTVTVNCSQNQDMNFLCTFYKVKGLRLWVSEVRS